MSTPFIVLEPSLSCSFRNVIAQTEKSSPLASTLCSFFRFVTLCCFATVNVATAWGQTFGRRSLKFVCVESQHLLLARACYLHIDTLLSREVLVLTLVQAVKSLNQGCPLTPLTTLTSPPSGHGSLVLKEGELYYIIGRSTTPTENPLPSFHFSSAPAETSAQSSTTSYTSSPSAPLL